MILNLSQSRQDATAARRLLKNLNSIRLSASSGKVRSSTALIALAGVALMGLAGLTGCGSSTNKAAPLSGLSSTTITLDAGQTIPVSTSVSQAYEGSLVSWVLSGGACASSGCGTISNTTGLTVNYSAPASVTAPITATLTASLSGASSQSAAITVNPAPTISGNLPSAILGTAYSATLSVRGGTSPVSMSLNGNLPAGLTFQPATGVISGTPTAAGTFKFAIVVQDGSSVPYTVTFPKILTVANASSSPGATDTLIYAGGSLPGGTVGTAYTTTLSVKGGTAPYTWSIASGTLPNGLSLNPSTGVISGTPSAVGAANFTVQVEDANNVKSSAPTSLNIQAAPAATLKFTGTSLPIGNVGQMYSASIPFTGGTAPTTCSRLSGALPAGLTMSGCNISGTPTAEGSSSITVQVVDSGNPIQTISGTLSIQIIAAKLAFTSSALPSGQVGVLYNASIPFTGGTAPMTCSVPPGALPAGLSMNGCNITGTPKTAGSSTIPVQVVDNSNPVQTISQSESLNIAPASLSITNPALPNGFVGQSYNGVIAISGGTVPYKCQLTSGNLPDGLELNGCTVVGTPTTDGTSTVTVEVSDSANPAQSVSGQQTITIGSSPLTFVGGGLPNAQVGVAYQATVGLTGGMAPYSCSIASGALPVGITLNGCTYTGTPTTAGISNFTVAVGDASKPEQSLSEPETITVDPAKLTLAPVTLPNGVIGATYSQIIPVAGGTAPYTCTLSSTSSPLPAGLTLSGCAIVGTPTTAGTSNLTITATDLENPPQSVTGSVALTITPSELVFASSSLPNATVGQPYAASIGLSGGTSPYSCSITNLPAGLTAQGCSISGTPTTAGKVTLSVTATDSEKPVQTATGNVTLDVVSSQLVVNFSTLPTGTVSVPYSASISVSGGAAPYTCAVITGLPAGLAQNNCSISGTPTAAGTSSLTIGVSDSSQPAQRVSGQESITINPPGALSLSGTLPNPVVNQPYSYTLTPSGGQTPYAYSVSSGSLPTGLSLNSSTGVISGTPTAVGAIVFTLQVTDSSAKQQKASNTYMMDVLYCPTTTSVPALTGAPSPSCANNAMLSGPYAYLFQGYDDAALGVLTYKTASVGSMTADGAGSITQGEVDANHQSSTSTSNVIGTDALVGSYEVGSDNTGELTLSSINPNGTIDSTNTYAITLKAPTAPATTYTVGSMIQYDKDQLAGTKGNGQLMAQSASAITAGLTGSYAFGLSGDTPCLLSCGVGVASGPVVTVGQFNVASNIITGEGDANVGSTRYSQGVLKGNLTGNADSYGRVPFLLTNNAVTDNRFPTSFVAYIVNSNEAFVMSNNTHASYELLAGTAQLQTNPNGFSNQSLSGPMIGYENAMVNPGLLGVALQSVLNYSSATIFRTVGNGSGSCNTTNVDNAGTNGAVNSLTSVLGNLLGLTSNNLAQALLGTYDSTGTASCQVESNGRATMQYPAPPSGLLGWLLNPILNILLPSSNPPMRVVYLISPGNGYFMESSYAGLGRIQPQTGSPFSLSSINGRYVEQTLPAASLANITSTGSFTADGNGNAVEKLRLNVGLGTLNLLTVGGTGNTTYTLNDGLKDNNANAYTTGRYVLGNGTTVIYAISPTQLVMIDTSALNTAPSVSILY